MLKKFSLFFGLVIALSLFMPLGIKALDFRSSDELTYGTKANFKSSTFLFASTLDFGGTVDGNLYLGGSEISLDGAKISGDLFVGATNLSIKNTEVSNLYLASGTLTIENTKISGDLIVGSGQVTLDETTEINGGVLIGSGVSILESKIHDDVVIGGGEVKINGKFDGNLQVRAGSLVVRKNTEILGRVNYRYSKEGKKAQISQDAKILGGFVEKQIITNPKFEKFLPNLSSFIFSLLMSWVVGLVLVLLAPLCMRRTAEILQNKPWASLGWGALVLFLGPVLILILLISVLGVPLALIFMGFYFLLVYLAKFFVAVWLGSKILKSMEKKHLPIWEMALGILIIYLLGIIPILGGWIKFLVLLFGLGMLVVKIGESYQQMRKKSEI